MTSVFEANGVPLSSSTRFASASPARIGDHQQQQRGRSGDRQDEGNSLSQLYNNGSAYNNQQQQQQMLQAPAGSPPRGQHTLFGGAVVQSSGSFPPSAVVSMSTMANNNFHNTSMNPAPIIMASNNAHIGGGGGVGNNAVYGGGVGLGLGSNNPTASPQSATTATTATMIGVGQQGALSYEGVNTNGGGGGFLGAPPPQSSSGDHQLMNPPSSGLMSSGGGGNMANTLAAAMAVLNGNAPNGSSSGCCSCVGGGGGFEDAGGCCSCCCDPRERLCGGPTRPPANNNECCGCGGGGGEGCSGDCCGCCGPTTYTNNGYPQHQQQFPSGNNQPPPPLAPMGMGTTTTNPINYGNNNNNYNYTNNNAGTTSSYYYQNQQDWCGCGCGDPNGQAAGGCCGMGGGCCANGPSSPSYIYTDKPMPPTCCDNSFMGILMMMILGAVGVVLLCVLPSTDAADKMYEVSGLISSSTEKQNANVVNIAMCRESEANFADGFWPRICYANEGAYPTATAVTTTTTSPSPGGGGGGGSTVGVNKTQWREGITALCTEINGLGFFAAASIPMCAEDIFSVQFVQSQITFYRNYAIAQYFIVFFLFLTAAVWAIRYNNNAWAIAELVKYGRIAPPTPVWPGGDGCCGPSPPPYPSPQYPAGQQQQGPNSYNNNNYYQQQVGGGGGGGAECCGCGSSAGDDGCCGLSCCGNSSTSGKAGGEIKSNSNSKKKDLSVEQPDYTRTFPILFHCTSHYYYFMGMWRLTGLVIAFSSIAVLYPLFALSPHWREHTRDGSSLQKFFSNVEIKFCAGILIADGLLLLPYLWDFVIKPLVWVLGVGPWFVYRTCCDPRVAQRPKGYRTSEEILNQDAETLMRISSFMADGAEGFDNTQSIYNNILVALPRQQSTQQGVGVGHNNNPLPLPSPSLNIVVPIPHGPMGSSAAAAPHIAANSGVGVATQQQQQQNEDPASMRLSRASTYMKTWGPPDIQPRVFSGLGGTASGRLSRPYAVQQHQLATVQLLSGYADGGVINPSAAVAHKASMLNTRIKTEIEHEEQRRVAQGAENTNNTDNATVATPRVTRSDSGAVGATNTLLAPSAQILIQNEAALRHSEREQALGWSPRAGNVQPPSQQQFARTATEAFFYNNNNTPNITTDANRNTIDAHSSKFIQDSLLFHQNVLYNDPNGADPNDIFENELSCLQQLDAFFIEERSCLCGPIVAGANQQAFARIALKEELLNQQLEIRRLRELSRRQEEQIRSGTKVKKSKSSRRGISSNSKDRGHPSSSGNEDGKKDKKKKDKKDKKNRDRSAESSNRKEKEETEGADAVEEGGVTPAFTATDGAENDDRRVEDKDRDDRKSKKEKKNKDERSKSARKSREKGDDDDVNDGDGRKSRGEKSKKDKKEKSSSKKRRSSASRIGGEEKEKEEGGETDGGVDGTEENENQERDTKHKRKEDKKKSTNSSSKRRSSTVVKKDDDGDVVIMDDGDEALAASPTTVTAAVEDWDEMANRRPPQREESTSPQLAATENDFKFNAPLPRPPLSASAAEIRGRESEPEDNFGAAFSPSPTPHRATITPLSNQADDIPLLTTDMNSIPSGAEDREKQQKKKKRENDDDDEDDRRDRRRSSRRSSAAVSGAESDKKHHHRSDKEKSSRSKEKKAAEKSGEKQHSRSHNKREKRDKKDKEEYGGSKV